MKIPAQRPWDVSVPIRAGDFTSLFPEHRDCNVETAMARIGSYGARQEPVPLDRLLLADQQTIPFIHVAGRLGSGRSGVYRGWYLKGVGRTPLAANWSFSDVNHNSGHMTASSAIREYVASCYLRALGAGHTIVPCQGVLLKRLSPKLRRFRSLLRTDFPEETLPPADAALQAITVKAGGFARASNFAWFLHHLAPRCVQDGRSSLSQWAQLLAAALAEPDGEGGLSRHEIRPKTLIAQVERALERTCENFGLWMKLGIWWGSFGNNLTLDGRFLDLETPSITGGPFLGRLSSEGILAGPIRRSSVIGTEIFYFLTQMQRFWRLAVQTLAGLPPLFHPIEREFARALAEAIESQLLGQDSLLGSRERAIQKAMDLHLSATPWLSAAALRTLRGILESEYEWIEGSGLYGEREEVAPSQHQPLGEIPPIISEAGVKWRFHARRLAGDEAVVPTLEAQECARGVNALIAEMDATRDVDELLSQLAGAAARVERLVGRLPVGKVPDGGLGSSTRNELPPAESSRSRPQLSIAARSLQATEYQG